ncbi:MAG: NUDIX hydrolase [Candidatus Pacebacteria bacterium]|jgi:8-oxo-dGTP diphosphatase|nr:NUDIX hydrolase [Candidatus Paceibacterota bacterium]
MDKGIIVHCAIMKENKLLILKRVQDTYQGNYWDLPGGTLEDGEDPAAGAIREAREETGLDVYDLTLSSYYSNVDETKNKQFITLIFLAKTDSDITEIKLCPEEHSEFLWDSPEEIKNRELVPYLKQYIDSGKILPSR